MSLLETLLFYLAIGLAVSVATYLRGDPRGPVGNLANAASACLFWPLYLPVLLAPQADRSAELGDARATKRVAADNDSLSAAISQVELELDTALTGLGGWAEDALAKEQGRISELRTAWRAQAEKIREIDALLKRTAANGASSESQSIPSTGRAEQSANARQQNFERLARVRAQSYEDLTNTLAWVRELVSMIHLARFTGAPASRAEELVAQIAAAVAGVSSVAEPDDETAFASLHT